MDTGKFKVGHACYQFSSPWYYEDECFQNITTWIYAGHFRLDCGSTDCDVPNHFYVFRPCGYFENVMELEPQRGLKIPSLEHANMSMITWEELAATLMLADDDDDFDLAGNPKIDRKQKPTDVGKFKVGQAYYRFAEPWHYDGESFQNIRTWIYAGQFQFQDDSDSCDVPHHFYVFHSCHHYDREDALQRDPEEGLKIPSLKDAGTSMLTWDELSAKLNEAEDDEE